MAEERNIQALNELLKKVTYSEKIYERAAKSVHSASFQKKLQQIAAERAAYREKIRAEIVARNGKPYDGSQVSLRLQELYLMVNDAYIERNMPNVLKVCMEADEELLEEQFKVMKGEHFLKESDPLAELIYGQYDKVKEQSSEFGKNMEAFPYKH